MSQRTINRVATLIKRRVLAKTPNGRLPRSERGWLRLYAEFGVGVGSTDKCPWHFRAQLKYEAKYNGWLVLYNASHSAKLRKQYLAHELAEFLAITEDPQQNLFDDRARIYSFNGGDTDDVRHRIAERFVHICFR